MIESSIVAGLLLCGNGILHRDAMGIHSHPALAVCTRRVRVRMGGSVTAPISQRESERASELASQRARERVRVKSQTRLWASLPLIL